MALNTRKWRCNPSIFDVLNRAAPVALFFCRDASGNNADAETAVSGSGSRCNNGCGFADCNVEVENAEEFYRRHKKAWALLNIPEIDDNHTPFLKISRKNMVTPGVSMALSGLLSG